MTGHEEQTETATPEALVEAERSFSAIWIVPLLAILIAAGLLYQSIEQRGAKVEISFSEASGVSAGKTSVRYRDVAIGTVEEVRLSEDLSHTVVVARIKRNAHQILVEGTRFWVERPRIGPEGVSGLTTLVSGAYLALDPGAPGGKRKLAFEGLADPPQILRDDPGLHLTLKSPAGALGLLYGSPVLHEGIQVGRITGLDLVPGKTDVNIRVLVDARFADRVHHNTRFWNDSGFAAHAGFDGIDFEFSSVETILTGAIGFATPGSPGKGAQNGARFPLFADRESAWRQYRESRGLGIELRTERLGSIADGDPVLYRGVKVGRVLGHRLAEDSREVSIRLQIDPSYVPLVREDSVFWNASGIHSQLGLTGLHVDVSSLEGLLEGGLAFATPDPPGPRAKPGARFDLAPKAKDHWRRWAPEISLALPETPRTTD